MSKQAWAVTLAMLVFSSCAEADDVDDLELEEEAEYEFRNAPLNHPSGVCRISSTLTWTSKRVRYYHVSEPWTIWFDNNCDPWVGTSECCEEKNHFGLSFEECAQLRHEPDCPLVGGGEPDGEGEEQDQPL